MNCIYGEKIYTGKRILEKGYLVFDGRRIEGISKARKGELLGKCPVLTPTFIDAHSHIGMVRAGEPTREEETNEQMESLSALPDALDSVQMDDSAFRDAVEMGVAYSCVLPGSGNVISGLSAVIRNYGKSSTEALVSRAGIKTAFGYNPMSTQDWKGSGLQPDGAVALFREVDGIAEKYWRRRARARRRKRHLSAEKGPAGY
jgi:imidazolonepropionase-like amidohydrolase